MGFGFFSEVAGTYCTGQDAFRKGYGRHLGPNHNRPTPSVRIDGEPAFLGLGAGLKKLAADKPFDLLKDFKLARFGYDPFAPQMEMNLVEQINQSATLLVGCAAVERLLQKHPSHAGYVISRPTSSGHDVWAEDVGVVAEVFAATSPGSNQKIKKDLKAVLKTKGSFAPKHRYVFFACRSSDGFPPKEPILEIGTDSQLGQVWWWREKAVTVVPLSEEAVFPQ